MTPIHKLVLVLLILIVGAALAFYELRFRDRVEAARCVRWYKEARTASETSAVDLRRPPREYGQGEHTAPIPTCGELRKLGHVR